MKSKLIRSILLIAVVSSFAVGSSGAYFSDTAVVSGNQFSTGTWSSLLINEVYYHGDEEWIELHNAGSTVMDIKGWSICDNANNCGGLNPSQKTEIPAGGFVVIAHDNNDLKDWTIPSSAETINYSGGKINFNDTGDRVILKNGEGVVVDQMSYANNAAVSGHSLIRISNGTFIDNPSPPTPGS